MELIDFNIASSQKLQDMMKVCAMREKQHYLKRSLCGW